MEHRGHHICNCFKKDKWFHNPLSGHSWSEPGDVIKNKFRISGPFAFNCGTFSSVTKAKEHIDFLIKYPWLPPITPAERKRVDKRIASGHPLGRDVTVEEEPFRIQRILEQIGERVGR